MATIFRSPSSSRGALAARTVAALAGWLLLCGLGGWRHAAGEQPLEYNRDIRPILADKCFACHGPDSAARQADLRLDQRDAAIEMGAIMPGDAEQSELLRRILSEDADEVMPPPETKKTVTARERELLARWIEQGAEYQLHWSFLVPQRPAVPDATSLAGGRYGDWPRNPIDHFVLARMVAAGLSPAAEADRRTLARRASLDLTGLPPDPKLVERFVADESPDAYEKLLDTLLDSPQWGEHRARYWLDYARYADTHGIHFDNFREMWTYRDWVIRAFNANLPFDHFTIENLAGDLLPDGTLDQRIGSGFNRCNVTTNEGGIIDEEYLVLYTRDRTETTSQVWLGLTAGCAVCHSHKFDPLSQQEFYQMAAFFNNTSQGARDGNIKDTPPILAVPLPEDRQRWQALPGLIEQARQSVQARRVAARSAYEQWLTEAKVETLRELEPREGLYLRMPADEGSGSVLQAVVDGQAREVALAENAAWEDGPSGKALQLPGVAGELPDVGSFERDQPLTLTAWIKAPASDGHGAICARMDKDAEFRGWDFWCQRRQIGMHVIHDWPENGLKVVAQNQVPANQWVHVAVSYDGSSKAAGVKVYYDGQSQPTNVENDKLSASIQTATPLKIGQRSTGEMFTGAVQDLRIYRRVLAPGEIEALARTQRFAGILATPADQRTDQQRDELFGFWLSALDGESKTLAAQLAQLERELNEIKARGTVAHVMQERSEPAMAFVLNRGEYDQRREQVQAGTPAVLPPFPDDFPRNRLGFARWLLLPEHPLTARVTVNRCWQEVFGTGLVKTAGDFGVMGQLPSHPELLDWLAIEFRESGWDLKRFYKLMLMSAAYRQSAQATPEKLQIDPDNRLLARGPRFRLDGESVRDYALAASGLLVPKIGGPSVKPYQPPGVWEAIAMNVSNTRQYEPGSGDELYRRSLYTFWKRQAPPASMEIFNAPNREYCVVQRERTNTALQALVTLNDPQFVEAARHLAERAIREGGDSLAGRVHVLGSRLLARDFRPEELTVIESSLGKLRTWYAEHPEEAQQLLDVGDSPVDASLDATELAAWTMLANQLLNLDEVLNK
ncbi:MAG: DUF1553 domain-containing protein [Pirellulaceae bacterium]|nr:DUF1553 domain-containing protein [Pirellulaceae bacterium]